MAGFLGDRKVMLIGAYCIIILPYIYQGIRNSMHAVNMPMLIEAAEMLGSSKLEAFIRVIIPNIISGITVSSLLAVGIIFGDYVLIRNITGSAFQNVQIFLFLAMKRSSTEASAVFVIIMLTTFLITALFLYVQSRDERQKIEEKGR
jgi:putative spermidine/putrescine transport system permease protein